MSTSSPAPPPATKEAVIKVEPLGIVPHKLDSIDVDTSEGAHQPPALPPRPPPRPRPCLEAGREAICLAHEANQGLQDSITSRVLSRSCWLRKYVFLCTVCGGLAILLGALFLTVYFMLRSYTSSLHFFETVPTYIPAASLIMTGLMVMSLAGRRNRYSYLMKVCGACCLCCAILCVVVTVTTTVFHMNRLQSLRECVFTQKTQTCTCYSVLLENTADRGDEGVRYIFNSTPDCEVIHGALYSCLRAMFGLSVIGILVCIFSCMLVYQLLSHEKKKMYWEQLELRCRYLSRQQRSGGHCSCCEECRYPPPPHPELFPWEMDDRYWTPRVGNLYSPNPGGHPPHARPRSGWNWRRLPWSRAANTPITATAAETTTGCMSASNNLRHATASPDSQYGFSSRPPASPTPSPAPTPVPAPQLFATETSQSFYMWGPPPPYSSPCRREPPRQRSPHGCHQGRTCSRPRPAAPEPGTAEACTRSLDDDANVKVRSGKKFPAGSAEHPPTLSSSSVDLGASGDYVNAAAATAGDACRGNTLPARKAKKTEGGCCAEAGRQQACRGGNAEDSEGYEGLQPCHVANHQCCHAEHGVCHAGSNIHHCHALDGQHCRPQACRRDDVNVSPRIKYLSRLTGISNEAFDTRESNREPTESEVYFADVSSCCNVSVKNESVIYDEAVDPQQCRNSPVRPGLRGLHEANVHRPYPVETTTEHRGYSRAQEPCSGRVLEEDRGYNRSQEPCPGRVPEDDIPLHRGYNRTTQEPCSGRVQGEDDRGYNRTTQEPCSGRVPEDDIPLHRGYNRMTQEPCSGRVQGEDDRGYNRMTQEPCSGRVPEDDIPLHRGYNRMTQEPCSGRVPELDRGYNRTQEPWSGRVLEDDIPLYRGYNRTHELCSGRVPEEDISLHRGYNRVTQEPCSGRVPEEDIPLHRGYNRVTQEPCSGRVPEEDIPLHRGYNRAHEHGHRVLEKSDTHLKEEDDREDLEQQNLLQSNCFSYQRFCASSPGFVLCEDVSWPPEAMECSSASVTPTSPATPLFYTRLQDQPDSTDYLAPDAQYETIPPLKPPQQNGNELSSPEMNGNGNEVIKPAAHFGSEATRVTENGNEVIKAVPRIGNEAQNSNEALKAAPRNRCETQNSNEAIKASPRNGNEAQNGNEGELRPSPARRRLNISPKSQTVRELLQNFENANVNNVNVDQDNG